MKNFFKKNKYFIRRLFALLLILFIFIFIYRIIRGNRNNDYKTIFPTLTTYERDIKTKIFNLYDEKVYFSKGEGIVVFNASEGQKVPLGYEVAYLNLMGDVSSFKDELNKIDAAIKLKKGLKPNDEEKSNKFSSDIQDLVKDKKYEKIYYDINSMDSSGVQNFNKQELEEYTDLSLETLESKKNELEENISKYNYSYLSEFSGVVTYKIDGNEEYFKIDDLDKFTYDYLNKNFTFSNLEMETKVKEGDPLFKLINNLRWNLACTIDNSKDIKDYKVGDLVKIQIEDMKDIYGNIAQINKNEKNAVIIVSLDRYFEEMYSNRIHKGKIIVERTKGYEIPKSTLITRDNMTGVFVQEIKGLVKFVPVEIVKEYKDTVFINRGNKQSVIMIGDKSYKTVTVNDALVINPKTVDESRILNWGDILDLKENLEKLYNEISEAKESSNFNRDVKLIAVSKTHPVEMINEFHKLGLNDFGENKVQELISKFDEVNGEINFHLIGNLQTNKVKYIYNKVKLIQSLDRIKLAKEIDKRAKADDISVDCLIQINIGEEESKSGILYEDTEKFIYELQEYDSINVKGLMAIAPNTDDELLLRKLFEKMNKMFEKLSSNNFDRVEMKYLSMGMSNDFKLAIKEGSNMIRVGSRLFGNRNYN